MTSQQTTTTTTTPSPQPPPPQPKPSPTKIDPNRILNINIGVLGHVDSGKTSLVKTLSTLLSTASLDKSNQSRQRGITLDLGFSAFVLELPQSFASHTSQYDLLQVTLVDCPGHASLIRTIIGGAQIIDMVLLVVDANKGIQTQTAECLVIAEMTTEDLIVVLNKIDLFSLEERSSKLEMVETKIRDALRYTRFRNVDMVGISAAVGGEKVAAATSTTELPTENIDGLLSLMKRTMHPPLRDRKHGNFHFAIDHCFPIRGQGTVVTGTVLSGCGKLNQMIEFPELGLERKIKSMQMFKRQVKQISQGDRAGICFSNLDSKLIERGIAASVGSVKVMDVAIAVVRKVRYFKGEIRSGAKFHVSVGHATVMATVVFFGAKEIRDRNDVVQESSSGSMKEDNNTKDEESNQLSSSSLGASADIAGLPRLKFDFEQDFIQMDEMVNTLDDDDDDENDSASSRDKTTKQRQKQQQQPPLHWAMLHFQTPIYCPLNSLIIASRFDTDIQANTCRLAFSGRLVEKLDPKKDSTQHHKLKIYTLKEKTGTIHRLGDPYHRSTDNKLVRYDLVGNDLFKKETNMNQFVGMKLVTPQNEVGVIQSSFGTSGKFKVHFPAGTTAKEGDTLFLRFKRFVHDETKRMFQDWIIVPERVGGRKVEVETKKEKTKKKQQQKKAAAKQQQQQQQNSDDCKSCAKEGIIASFKSEVLENGKPSMAIVSGLFTPEDNVRDRIGAKVIVLETKEEGTIAGSFGKAGKCKVLFEDGVSAVVGSKVNLILS